MGKNQKVKSVKPKAKRQKQADPKTHENEPGELPNIEGDAYNFGGLPERNLKKNLGCG